MKQLLIIRHAKSDWNALIPRDFDRSLNDRGHRDAPSMAKRMIDRKVKLDAIITSTALRAFTTANYFASVYSSETKKTIPIIEKPELYLAEPPIFFDVIRKTDDNYNNIAIFSHNPGITHFINQLGVAQLDEMPTCGIFAITIDAKSWSDFKKAKKQFLFFDYPKNG